MLKSQDWKMVRHKQPRPLYKLCHQRFCEYLGERVVRTGGYDSSGILI